MYYRDLLQRLLYCIIDPVVRGMHALGITPNILTTIGVLGNVGAAALLVGATLTRPDEPGWLALSGGIILLFSLFDMMDGRLARLTGQSSTFGAFYDSVTDRYSELVTLFAVAFCLDSHGDTAGTILTALAITGSLMVSYTRARAEGLGVECKVGLMQRPERVVVTLLALILTGLIPATPHFDPYCLLTAGMGLIALLANLTAIWRIIHVYRKV